MFGEPAPFCEPAHVEFNLQPAQKAKQHDQHR